MNAGATAKSSELLSLVLDAAREMSRHDDPAAAGRVGRTLAQQILKFDRSLSATRRDMPAGAIRLLRAYAPGCAFDDPHGDNEHPLLTRGILCDLLYAAEARVIAELSVDSSDPAAEYLRGMRSLAAIPQFRGGEASAMVFHLRSEPHAFDAERLAELVMISNLFGQSLSHLGRAREAAAAEQSIKQQYEIIASLSNTVMNSALDLKHDNELLERRVRERTRELAEANLDAIYMLALASEAKDEETGAHLRRILDLTRRIALTLGFNERDADDLAIASVLHDVGKIHVPDSILKKPGPLTDEERAIMREHTIAGERILADKPFFAAARRIARSHHENFDGSGYPDAFSGDAIPIEARIVHVADVYDALISPRVYKPAWGHDGAIDFIRQSRGAMFDPAVVEAFVSGGS